MSTMHGPVTASSNFNTGLSQLALQGFGVEDMPPGDITTYMSQASTSKLVTPMVRMCFIKIFNAFSDLDVHVNISLYLSNIS